MMRAIETHTKDIRGTPEYIVSKKQALKHS